MAMHLSNDGPTDPPARGGGASLSRSDFYSLTQARHLPFWDYDRDEQLSCPACDWRGTGHLADEELYQALFDVRCPHCDCILLVVAYPTDDETRSAAAAGNPLAAAELPRVLAREELRQLREQHELVDPASLPDIQGDSLVIEWDMEVGEPGWTVLRWVDTELWREPVYYEGIDRYREVARIFQRRYGSRLVELRPTEASELYLYGDALSAPAVVADINRSLRAGRPL